ncbi:MAG: hypothetical protein IVW55_11270 [Chloroflexi bacterium]|nr:hypothetical protein [Chloroflexota bacterium]
MSGESSGGIPRSPEAQEPYVREELDQDLVTHRGDYRAASQKKHDTADGNRMHLGAVDDEVVPVVPPMSGPADLVGEKDIDAQGNETGDTEVGEELIDPRDSLTPG